jgi:aminoglycoside/choline kinase family phosphotransferase
MHDPRLTLILDWLQNTLVLHVQSCEPASADASFRRYFRVSVLEQGVSFTRIVMDAPPAHEDIRPFLRIDQHLAACGVHVPHIYAYSIEHGLMLLEDLGSTPYLAALQKAQALDLTPSPLAVEGARAQHETNSQCADTLYTQALNALLHLQTCPSDDLPPYDHAKLLSEMQLFETWYLRQHLGLELGEDDTALLNATYAQLAARALAQPQGFVHRDYHSRNLMLTPDNSPGIIDFQDAVHGPITYDLASLLRDSYIEWPESLVEAWLQKHHHALQQNQPDIPAWEHFKTDFDWMSAQRHLKVLGIFARLHHRDGKSGYLADLPLTLRNLHRSLAPYPEFAEFIDWLNQHGCARP